MASLLIENLEPLFHSYRRRVDQKLTPPHKNNNPTSMIKCIENIGIVEEIIFNQTKLGTKAITNI